MIRTSICLVAFALFFLVSCSTTKEERKLPFLGVQTIETTITDGKEIKDTLQHTIKEFAFLNQDSLLITNKDLDGSVYVADFFFTSCPSICPAMKKQLLRVHEKYKGNNLVSIVSHTIDPGHDDVPVLKDYAERLEVKAPKWHFLTGDLFQIYDLAESSYMVFAEEDASAPGGFVHSGALMLIDAKRHVRGVYDGTVEEQVNLLMNDMDLLLKEYEK